VSQDRGEDDKPEELLGFRPNPYNNGVFGFFWEKFGKGPLINVSRMGDDYSNGDYGG
jgi:hypothetical protein